MITVYLVNNSWPNLLANLTCQHLPIPPSLFTRGCNIFSSFSADIDVCLVNPMVCLAGMSERMKRENTPVNKKNWDEQTFYWNNAKHYALSSCLNIKLQTPPQIMWDWIDCHKMYRWQVISAPCRVMTAGLFWLIQQRSWLPWLTCW